VELYAADGSVGAAIGAGIGVGVFTEGDAFNQAQPPQVVTPHATGVYDDLYLKWKATLQKQLEKV
jgi:xylulokinase